MRLGDVITPNGWCVKDFDFSQDKERDSTQLTPEDSHGVFFQLIGPYTKQNLPHLKIMLENSSSQQLITQDSTVYVYINTFFL